VNTGDGSTVCIAAQAVKPLPTANKKQWWIREEKNYAGPTLSKEKEPFWCQTDDNQNQGMFGPSSRQISVLTGCGPEIWCPI
jgi:hypothetical protein